jgi:hypothetical protein
MDSENVNYTTLFDVFPKIETKAEIALQVEQVKDYLTEQGRTVCSPDEAIFIATIDKTIEILKKAKGMLANNRFTVLYRGEEVNDCPQISEFEIIPIRPKAEKVP